MLQKEKKEMREGFLSCHKYRFVIRQLIESPIDIKIHVQLLL